MLESGLSIVISSRETMEMKKDFLEMVAKTCGYNHHIFFITNTDGIPLTQVYNEALNQSPFDIVCFIHDDIDFLKDGWGKEIVTLFDKHQDYGIIGVAGAAEFDEKGAWWNYELKYGQVLHRSEGKAWLSAFSPLLKTDLEEVCVVDGLCFAAHRQRISKRFDTEIKGFHMYEIDFCLANYVDQQTKIGVTTNIRIAHESIGKLNDKWYDNREIVTEKYKNYYPIKIKK